MEPLFMYLFFVSFCSMIDVLVKKFSRISYNLNVTLLWFVYYLTENFPCKQNSVARFLHLSWYWIKVNEIKFCLRQLYEKNNWHNLFHELSCLYRKWYANCFSVFIYIQFIPEICVKSVHMELLFYAFCYFLVFYLSSSSLQLRLWFIIQYSI